jgi:hypothetical protein
MRRLLAMFLVVVMLAGSHAGLAPSARADDAPSAVMAGDRLTVFARASNGKLAHRWYDGTKGSWTEWAEISDTEITSAPSAAMGPPEGRLHVFARGTNGKLLVTYRDGVDGKWADWQTLGTKEISSSPSAVLMRGDLWVIARAEDGKLMELHHEQGKGWTDWAPVK